ncbi:MAG TPA: HK97-gp10 family putative phage morphogenesis protein [Anaeromyxobacteraceae bacterium]|nr:HK97-gp10 family putative phage morphogenesis protein [Anaeromyxobacteraceae bacterium]
MSVTIEVQGASRLQSLLGRLSGRIAAAVAEETLAGAEAVAREAKALAPVDTGRLRASIEALREGRTSAVVVARAPYAAFVEYGTRRMAAQPFMRPAAQRARAEVAARIGEAVRRETRAAA